MKSNSPNSPHLIFTSVETNILRSVRVNENTISYGQWLQNFPILEASKNNYVAAVMLKSSLYVLNKECRE
jgi:O-acetylhomoserine/O-acetylserine sulfhydrylase-like pyridoxal-dependent enzyme